MRTKLFAAAALGVLALGTVVSLRANADETDTAPHRERCAIRLSIALQGQDDLQMTLRCPEIADY
jgi:uncharacterized membrane protein